jgi:uncharacterized lipoprotein NlpE involved in copper resistance
MKKILTLLLCTVLLCACSNDDSNNNVNPGNDGIQGRWNLNSYIAFVDVLPVLEQGDITWTFNEGGTALVVNNTVQDAYPYMLASGTYDVTVTGGALSMLADGYESRYEYDFTDGTLSLRDTRNSGDGPRMEFSRN